MSRKLFLLLVLGLVSATAVADSGTLSANTSLHSQPGGPVVATLLANTLVEIRERQEGWYRVSASGGRDGWVRIGSVRLAGQHQSESVFSGLWGWLNSGRSVRSGGTATAGIRGLDAADIEAAEPDFAALDRLDTMMVTSEAARRYAAELPLQRRDLPPVRETR